SRAQNLVPVPVKPVTSKDLADEINLIVDLDITNWWTVAITLAVNIPDRAARQIPGGRQTWIQSGMWSGWAFSVLTGRAGLVLPGNFHRNEKAQNVFRSFATPPRLKSGAIFV